MAVLLSKAYGGYAAGTVRDFPRSTELALIAQSLAVASSAVVTYGAATTNQLEGTAGIAAGAASVVITHPAVTVSSQIKANFAQAAIDATLIEPLRVICAAGSFTITGTTAATAVVQVKWQITDPNT